jgi:hypothetical protein
MLDALLVPRDARGIVLACGFVATAALGVSALLLGDPIGYGYLVGAAIGYFFLQTRLVPTVLWLLISFGGAAGATAGNTSDWIICGLGLLLAGVSLLRVPAAFRGAMDGPIPDSSRTELESVATDEQPLNGVMPTNGQLESAAPADLSLSNVDKHSRSSGLLIQSIGRLRLEVSGHDLTQRLNEQPRLEFLFSYLLAREITGVGAVDRPALADEVAPGVPAAGQRDRLRKQLYALQSTLGAGAKTLLRITTTHVSLDLTQADHDARRLEEMSGRVTRRKSLIGPEVAEEIRSALDKTAAGEFLAGFTELEHQVTGGQGTATEIVTQARTLITGWRADLVKALAEYDLASGHPQVSIAYLKSALAVCTDRQDLARLLVGAYLQTGQTARATELSLEYELTQEK